MTVRVLGLDISLTATGIAFPGGTCQTIRPLGGPDGHGRRLWSIQRAFDRLPLAGKVDVAVIEAYALGGQQGLTMARIAEAGGIIRASLFARSIPWVDMVHPTSLKKWATGKGTAQKNEMVRSARNRGASVANDNEADAWWLRNVGDVFYNAPIEAWGALETHQQDLLNRIDWPKI